MLAVWHMKSTCPDQRCPGRPCRVPPAVTCCSATAGITNLMPPSPPPSDAFCWRPTGWLCGESWLGSWVLSVRVRQAVGSSSFVPIHGWPPPLPPTRSPIFCAFGYESPSSTFTGSWHGGKRDQPRWNNPCERSTGTGRREEGGKKKRYRQSLGNCMERSSGRPSNAYGPHSAHVKWMHPLHPRPALFVRLSRQPM